MNSACLLQTSNVVNRVLQFFPSETSNVGAVANLRRVKHAASVARAVLNHTHHSILAGDQATKFAVQMGFKEETLETDHSKWLWMNWTMAACQPNFWTVRFCCILGFN